MKTKSIAEVSRISAEWWGEKLFRNSSKIPKENREKFVSGLASSIEKALDGSYKRKMPKIKISVGDETYKAFDESVINLAMTVDEEDISFNKMIYSSLIAASIAAYPSVNEEIDVNMEVSIDHIVVTVFDNYTGEAKKQSVIYADDNYLEKSLKELQVQIEGATEDIENSRKKIENIGNTIEMCKKLIGKDDNNVVNLSDIDYDKNKTK